MNLSFKERAPPLLSLRVHCVEKQPCKYNPLIVPAGDERGEDVCATRPLSVLCQLDHKRLPVLHRLFAASHSAGVAPPALNASETAVTSADAGPPPRFFIGLSLTLGFTLMFVVDQLGGYLSSHGMFGKTVSLL